MQHPLELAVGGNTAAAATLTPPADATRAPFGHYMLWLVDSAGEVSAAAWTRF
jgi:hypothetical protein